MALSLKAEELHIGEIVITNSLLTGSLIGISLIIFFIYFNSKLKIKPTSAFQLIIEDIVLGFYDLATDIMGKKATKTFFPFIFTIFIIILSSNLFGLLPVVGSVGGTKEVHSDESSFPILVLDAEEKSFNFTTHYEIYKPIFRSPSADINFTLALGIISFLLIQYAGLQALGLSYLNKFFDLRVKVPKGWKIIFTPLIFLLNLFAKLLETILEFVKIVSFSFRLFGNIFAGEVLLYVITTLSFGLVTLPFLGFEVFIGLIQAVVFSFLTMVFIKVASDHHVH